MRLLTKKYNLQNRNLSFNMVMIGKENEFVAVHNLNAINEHSTIKKDFFSLLKNIDEIKIGAKTRYISRKCHYMTNFGNKRVKEVDFFLSEYNYKKIKKYINLGKYCDIAA